MATMLRPMHAEALGAGIATNEASRPPAVQGRGGWAP